MLKRFLTDESGIDHPVALGISIAAVALLVAALYAATKGGYGAIKNGLGSTTNSAGNALNGINSDGGAAGKPFCFALFW
jgi:hypothetical protein